MSNADYPSEDVLRDYYDGLLDPVEDAEKIYEVELYLAYYPELELVYYDQYCDDDWEYDYD